MNGLRIGYWMNRIRLSHALEHATMHVLARSGPPLQLVGRSDWNGFTLYGEVDTDRVLHAATEALARLQGGQAWLAYHQRCGTNVAATALLVSVAAVLGAAVPVRSRLARAASIVVAMILATRAARPLGIVAQRYVTTSTGIGDTGIRLVRRDSAAGMTMHRISVAHDLPGG